LSIKLHLHGKLIGCCFCYKIKSSHLIALHVVTFYVDKVFRKAKYCQYSTALISTPKIQIL